MEAPQMRGVEEPLLPEPRAVEGGATQSEGAIETQEARYPRLHKTAGLRSLDVWVEISRSCAMLRVPPTPCPGSPRVPTLPPFPLERACGFSAVARGWHSLRARGRARADLRRRYQDHQDHQDLFLRYPHEHLFS